MDPLQRGQDRVVVLARSWALSQGRLTATGAGIRCWDRSVAGTPVSCEPDQEWAYDVGPRDSLPSLLPADDGRTVGPSGVTVNCVAPGRIATARLDELYPDGPSDEQLDEIALHRWGKPREFGDVVCFLASGRAQYVTGQTLVVDGGMKRALF